MIRPITWSYKVAKPVLLDTGILARYFARILRKGQDFAVTVYGEKRFGKSVSTAELIRQIDQVNKKKFTIKKDVVFYLKDFYLAMDTAEPYTCKMLDDFGSEAESKRSTEQAAIDLSHYFHTSGTKKVGYFITTPTQGWINKDMRERVASYFMWITRKSENPRYAVAKLFYLQKNEAKKKVYTHNLCLSPNGFVNNRGIGNPITEWVLYPLPKQLEEEYYPYRLAKAERNLEKGLQNIIDEENKNKEFSPYETADLILKNWDKYYNIPLGRKTKVLDKGLIQADFQLGGRKYEQVKSVINKKLNTGSNPSPTTIEKPPI